MDEFEREILELRTHYRNVFDSSSGRVVFHDLLVRSNFFDAISHEDPETLGKRNMMMEVIKILGAYAENPERVSEAIATAILQQPISEVKREEDAM